MAALFAGIAVTEASTRPAKPQSSRTGTTDQCRWVWVQGRGIGLWSEACRLPTGRWRVVWRAGDPPAITATDEIPEPPCGELGVSTHGLRYFMTDLRQPGRVVHVNEGQDGLLFDPRSITLD